MNAESTRSNEAFGIGEVAGKSLIVVDGEGSGGGLAAGAGQSLGVGIEAEQLHVGMQALEGGGQRAGAAANLENLLAGAEVGLIKQCPADRFSPEQLHDRVIER